MTVTAPDLVVDAPTVSDSNPAVGTSFNLRATVRNQGNGAMRPGVFLRYYSSTDDTITTGDNQVGRSPVRALNAGDTSAEFIRLTAPSSAGTYYYGACVDAVTNESDTTNNCSAAVRVTVTAPDLVVDRPTVSAGSPLTGASFTLSAAVRNNGGSAAGSTILRYYRSSDDTISESDTSIGTDSVSGLNAGGTSVESISVTAPSSAGTYYYGACVDAVTNESDTTNNCSAAVRVSVVAPPDLVVGTPRVSDSNPVAGMSFTLSTRVRNQGGSAAGSSTLRYYRSRDATIDTNDTSVGTDAVSGLPAGNTSDESISLTAPATAGTYYYGACVGSVTNEFDTANNCSAAVTVTVGGSAGLQRGSQHRPQCGGEQRGRDGCWFPRNGHRRRQRHSDLQPGGDGHGLLLHRVDQRADPDQRRPELRGQVELLGNGDGRRRQGGHGHHRGDHQGHQRERAADSHRPSPTDCLRE